MLRQVPFNGKIKLTVKKIWAVKSEGATNYVETYTNHACAKAHMLGREYHFAMWLMTKDMPSAGGS